ncbi:poly-gamma-glutamate hydrolase family protein [Bacillus safensis]|uniref:poly-gamma-glutamate hydrolase family protein n=1 Tax=Bacillus safensis TaxID=561879 RepID=UPI00227E2CE0|nr:poly-gamma-glutamate hydrolase family protein [Bacillus safensis]MCY7726919.1 poly-gamma-glutamate hydrolase family protein [Bacillus safensis]MED0883280.1 poly-gamma-glutamate hydrolase family protein [Bacillus safensis]MED0916971.1 poly-gamma-glutamate hydrolase family protein [Bacillus safensis]
MKRLLICGFIFLILCTLLMVKCTHSVQEKKEQKKHYQELEKYQKERKQGDQYESFKQLIRHEKEGYEIEFHEKGGSDLLVFSPHGGEIEPGTSEIVEAFQESYSTYLFEGTKQDNNRDLHITSTNFDEPVLVQMIKTYPFSISIHGYKSDKRHTLVGGTNEKMQRAVVRELKDRGFSAEMVQKGERLSGTDPKNINNQNASGESVQLEISTAQREAFFDNFDTRKGKKKAFRRYINALKEVLREFDPSS